MGFGHVVPQHDFECPIQPFSLSISLRMDRGTQSNLCLERLEQVLPELWGDLTGLFQ
jgi:hypothetical protein